MKILAINKKAIHDYEMLEKLEAGVVLEGYEAKSVKNGNIQLKGSFVSLQKGEPVVSGMHIGKYAPAGKLPDYDPTRVRKLLLKKREIAYLSAKIQEKGLTIVPIKVYTNNRFIKLEIAVARGRKKYDKREIIKKRETDREMQRILKRN